jgi:hypothetical protein
VIGLALALAPEGMGNEINERRLWDPEVYAKIVDLSDRAKWHDLVSHRFLLL